MGKLGLRRFFSGLVLAALAGCASAPEAPSESLADRLESHVVILASDDFEGRGTGRPGYDRAASYVAEFFEEIGLEPGSPDYFQDVPLVGIDPESIDGSMELTVAGEPVELIVGEDVGFFPPNGGGTENWTASASGEIVFAGDAVNAPSFGFDSLAQIEVDGKIVMFVTGASDVDDAASAIHMRRTDVKRAELIRRGAAGLIVIDRRERPIERVTRFRAFRPEGVVTVGETGRIIPSAAISLDTARRIFNASGRDFDAVFAAVKEGVNLAFPLDASASLSTEASVTPIASANVLGIVPGNDPALAGEAVVVTAHLDHLGKREPEEPSGETGEDVIFNGALDNATGTAIMMEAAKRLVDAGGAERTVIFAALTAEELGLLGSKHLAATVDALGYEAVANVNIDMPVLTYPLNNIIGFGEKYSSMSKPFRAAAADAGLGATEDPLPGLGLFVRSDHYRFVQRGVPSIFLFSGMSGDNQAKFETFMATHYHKPSDETDLPINWADGAKFANVAYGLIKRVADDPQKPAWNEGVVFAPSGSES